MKRRVTFKFKFLILLICIAYCGVMFINQAVVASSQRQTKLELEEKLRDVKYQNIFLKNKLEYLNSDEYYEEAARKRFGWVKEGERVYLEDKLSE